MAIVPAFYLSDAVQKNEKGSDATQVSLMLEPDQLIHLNGLSIGARGIAGAKAAYLEPMVRYRHWLDLGHRLAIAGVAYGTHASGSDSGASYSMTRGGAEVGVDLAVTRSHFSALHLDAGGAASGVSASGHYCVGGDGWAVQCPDGTVGDTYTRLDGVFPAAFGGISVDMGFDLAKYFRSGRLSLLGAVGDMPAIQYGHHERFRGWSEIGLSLTLAVGVAAGHGP